MTTSDSHETSTCLLIYDEACRLCVAAKDGLERQGVAKHVRFVPYQSQEAAQALGHAYEPGRPDVAYLVEEDGKVIPGLDAFVALLPGLPSGRILLRLWRVRLLRPFAYFAYWLVARYRYRWFGAVRED